MNGGLVTLANWLIHAGDEKARQKEYDRRQKELEEKQTRQAIARDSLIRSREIDDMGRREKFDMAKEERANQMKEEAALAKEQRDYNLTLRSAATIKRNEKVPFPQWSPEDQAAVLTTANNDVGKVYKWIEDVQQGATHHEVASSIADSIAKGQEANNRAVAATAIAPTVARDAVAKSNEDYLTNRGGGIPVATQLHQPNRIVIQPDASIDVKKNEFAPPDKDAALMEALKDGTSKNSLGALVTGQTDSIYKNPAAQGIDPSGNTVRPTITHWGPETPSNEPIPPGGRMSIFGNQQPVQAPSWPPQTQDDIIAQQKAIEDEAIKQELYRRALNNRPVPLGQSNWQQ